MRTIILVAACTSLSAVSACSDDTERTTLSEARSPDGHWIARVYREQHFGPGTAGVLGGVELQRVGTHQDPIQVVLVEQPDTRPDHVKAEWRASDHLQVGYRAAQLDLQVVKAGGIEIATGELR